MTYLKMDTVVLLLACSLNGIFCHLAHCEEMDTEAGEERYSAGKPMLAFHTDLLKQAWRGCWVTGEHSVIREYSREQHKDNWDFNERDMENLTKTQGLEKIKVNGGTLRFTIKAGIQGSLQWGENDSKAEQISFPYSNFSIRLRVKQSASSSTWRFYLLQKGKSFRGAALDGKSINVRGSGWKDLCIELGSNVPLADTFRITIESPRDNQIEIDEVELFCVQERGAMRHTFDIDGDVIKSLLQIGPYCDFYVNGRRIVKSADLIQPKGMLRSARVVDLQPHLRQGKNVVCMSTDLLHPMKNRTGYSLMAQGRCILSNGRTIDLDTPGNWRFSPRSASGWTKVGFDDSRWLELSKDRNSSRQLSSYSRFPGGSMPIYDGNLSLRNLNGKLPHGFYDGQVRIALLAPGNARLGKITWRLVDSITEKKIVEGELAMKKSVGKQVAEWNQDLKNGAYYLYLKPESGDEIVTEFLVLGPTGQKEVAGDSLTQGMQLTLVDQVNCTERTHNFVEQGNTPSKVVRKGDLVYRQTDSRNRGSEWSKMQNYFGYRLRVPKPLEFYLFEVDVPDDGRRAMYINQTILESNVRIDRKTYSNPKFSANAFCTTGYVRPNTGKTKTVRFVSWVRTPTPWVFLSCVPPGSNHDGAAASAIRVYRLNNGLPALRLPSRPGRLFGGFLERQNVIEETFAFGGRRKYSGISWRPAVAGSYLGQYRDMFRCKIDPAVRYMRFSGQNCLFAGVFMYAFDICSGHGDGVSGLELPDPQLYMMMAFDRNGLALVPSLQFQKLYYGDIDFPLELTPSRKKSSNALILCDGKIHTRKNSTNGGLQVTPLLNPVLEQLKRKLYRFKHYQEFPSFRGILLVNKLSGYDGVGGTFFPDFYPRYRFGGLSAGYNDQLVNKFQRDTGIRVPVNRNSPERFQKYFEFLNGKKKKEWVRWRCSKSLEMHKDIEAFSKRYLGKPVFVANCVSNMIVRAKKDGRPLPDVLRESGYNPGSYKAGQNLRMSNSVYNLTRMLRGKGGFSHDEYYDALLAHNSQTDSYSSGFNLIWGGLMEFWLKPTQTYNYDRRLLAGVGSVPSEYELAMSLAKADADVTAYGENDCTFFNGNEEDIRAFTREYLVLPKGHYVDCALTTLPSGIKARELKQGKQLYLYLINTNPTPTTLQLKATGELRYLRTNKVVPDRITLGGFRLQTFTLSGDGKLLAIASVSRQPNRVAQKDRTK